MITSLRLCSVTLALALPIAAMADAPGVSPAASLVSAAGCPPGLAKKNPPCVPPGQARKGYEHSYRVGERLPDGFIILRSPSRYGLDPRRTYYERDGYIVQVDRETRQILNLIGAISDILQ
jgi:hypothetical protein